MRKLLADLSLLAGQTEEITMVDLRQGPGDVLDQVTMGKTYIITRRGKSIAVLQQLPGHNMTIVVAPNGGISYRCGT